MMNADLPRENQRKSAPFCVISVLFLGFFDKLLDVATQQNSYLTIILRPKQQPGNQRAWISQFAIHRRRFCLAGWNRLAQ
jgi:hypothetical protein